MERKGLDLPRTDLMRILSVFTLALVLFNLGNWLLPLTDPVEAIYGQVAKEMLQGGDCVSPRLCGRPFFEKPPFLYWVLTASHRLFGINDWAARFPVTVFAALCATMIYILASRIFNRRAALFGTLVLAGTFEFSILSRMILTDVLLVFFISACLSSFLLGWRSEPSRPWLIRLAYVFAGLAVVTKGPLGMLLPGLVIAVFLVATGGWRRWRELRLFSGAFLFLVLAVPWYFIMWKLHGEAFISNFFGVHNFLRTVDAQHPQLNRWWYYLAMLAIGFFPWAGLVPFGLALGWPRSWRGLSRQAMDGVFLLIWAVAPFVFFNLVATKYPTYTLPIFFPLAVLAGAVLDRNWERLELNPTALALWHLPVMLVMLLLPAGLILLSRKHASDSWLSLIPLCSLLLAGLAVVIWSLARRRWRTLSVTLAVIGLLQVPLLVMTAIGPYSYLFSTRDAVKQLQDLGWRGEPLGFYGGYAWSAVYYSGQYVPKLTTEQPPDPTAISWEVKYVMPRESPASFLDQPGRRYVLAPSNAVLPEPLRQKLEEIGGIGEVTLYRTKDDGAGD